MAAAATLAANLALQKQLRDGLRALDGRIETAGVKRRHLLDQMLEISWPSVDPDYVEETETRCEAAAAHAKAVEDEFDRVRKAAKPRWSAAEDAALAGAVASEPDWEHPDWDRVAAAVTALAAARALEVWAVAVADRDARAAAEAARVAALGPPAAAGPPPAAALGAPAAAGPPPAAAADGDEPPRKKKLGRRPGPPKDPYATAAGDGGATAAHCERRWAAALRPRAGPFTELENRMLHAIVEANQGHRWDICAAFLNQREEGEPWRPARTAVECLKHYQRRLNPCMIDAAWSEDDDRRVVEHVRHFGANSWQFLADELGRRTAKQCRDRWHGHLKHELVGGNVKGKWFPVEEQRLVLAVHFHSDEGVDKLVNAPIREEAGFWQRVAVHVPSRTASQCREKWHCSFSGDYNAGEWAPAEIDALAAAVDARGVGNWTRIAGDVKTRKDYQCKQKYWDLQGKGLLGPQSDDDDDVDGAPTRALEDALLLDDSDSGGDIDSGDDMSEGAPTRALEDALLLDDGDSGDDMSEG
jgi:myb proto-oncogene protein